jgi:tripartite tricarboxylate transporter family receptor
MSKVLVLVVMTMTAAFIPGHVSAYPISQADADQKCAENGKKWNPASRGAKVCSWCDYAPGGKEPVRCHWLSCSQSGCDFTSARQKPSRPGRLPPTRSDALPDLPTVSEFVPGFEASFWTGIGAPRNTPTEIVDKLNKEINAGLADPKIKTRLADLGSTPLVGSAADFAKHIAHETEKWGKVIKFAGIKAE